MMTATTTKKFLCGYCHVGTFDKLPGECPNCGCHLTINLSEPAKVKMAELFAAVEANGFELQVSMRPKKES